MKKNKDLEADYFIKQNADDKHRLEEEEKRQLKQEVDEEQKALHLMKCPKCGHDLVKKRMSYIDVDQCTSCGALVLMPEDIDGFITEEKSILKSFIDFFKP
jgi:hypothetical protein